MAQGWACSSLKGYFSMDKDNSSKDAVAVLLLAAGPILVFIALGALVVGLFL